MNPEGFRLPDHVLDLRRRCLRRTGGEEVPLRPKTFAVLVCFIRNRDRALSKQELVDAVWPRVVVEEQAVYQSISELRAAIGDPACIRTVRGYGYQWVTPVRELPAPVTSQRSRAVLAGAAAIVAAIVIFATGSFETTGTIDSEANVPVARLIDRVRQHVADGEFEAAESYLALVLHSHPGILEARIALAHVYDQSGRTSRALLVAQSAYADAETDSNSTARADAALLIGNILLRDSNIAEAERYATNALAAAARVDEPSFAAAAHELLAEISMAAGNVLHARAALTDALKLYGDSCPSGAKRVEERLTALL